MAIDEIRLSTLFCNESVLKNNNIQKQKKVDEERILIIEPKVHSIKSNC